MLEILANLLSSYMADMLKCTFLKVQCACDFKWHKLALTEWCFPVISRGLWLPIHPMLQLAWPNYKDISGRTVCQSCLLLFPCLSSEFCIKGLMLHLLRRLACFISKKDVNSHGLGCDKKIKLSTIPESIYRDGWKSVSRTVSTEIKCNMCKVLSVGNSEGKNRPVGKMMPEIENYRWGETIAYLQKGLVKWLSSTILFLSSRGGSCLYWRDLLDM